MREDYPWSVGKPEGEHENLSPEQKNCFSEILQKKTRKYGYATDLSTLKRIADF